MSRARARSTPSRRRRPFLPAALLALLALAPAGARAPRAIDDFDAPTVAWREGPVRYLLTKDEDDAYRALKTDAARAAFIQAFWTIRDPQPATLQNEYRILFYRRVLEASRLFIDSPTAGWKTDRGKIYILLGPPDEQERLGEPQSAREMIIWTYRSSPSGMGLERRSAVRFRKDSTGEYRLTGDSILDNRDTDLGLGLQVQAMQMKSLPEQHRVLDGIVTAHAFLDSAPFRTHRDFFRSADGNTFVVVTVGVKQTLLTSGSPGGTPMKETAPPAAGQPPEPAPPPATPAPARPLHFEVVARLAGEDAGLPTYDLAGTDGLHPAREDESAGPDDYLLFQGGVTVKPGRYIAYYGVVDTGSTQIVSFKEPIVVPDFKDNAFQLSSVTLASSIERVSADRSRDYSTPFVLGNLRVLPRPDDQFHNGETFAFYYQIYGPATDPIDGRPDLDVEYQFFSARVASSDGEPAFEPLGKPIRLTGQQGQVQGYSFPLQDWPAATYRLRVDITDRLSGKHASRDVTFRVL